MRNRQLEDKYQDGADFLRMARHNPNVDLAKLKRLGEWVYAGGGKEIGQLIDKIKSGKPIEFCNGNNEARRDRAKGERE